ncbi:MAG: sugar ABC transporter permease [Oscillospiraceae bacterium]|nr:sugar ABC transporter permease [Oscillospiraceae bacterium]
MTKRKAARKLRAAVGLHAVLAALAAVWLLPVAWLLLSSLRQEQGAYTPYLMPRAFTLGNYARLFTDTSLFNFPRWFLNTLFVALCSCLITTVLTLMVAYVYSRLRFRSRKALMNVSLVLGMFPGFMSMIAIYHFMKAIGLDQTLLALILVYSGGAALNYYIVKGFFDTIPKSLDEAATIDGATRHDIFWRIILPSAKPVIANTAINAFIAPWVDFIFVSVIMKDNYNNYTVAKGLYTMVDKANIYHYYTVFCAGAVVVALPIVLLFIRLQKYYVAGVTSGAVKG